MQDAEVPVAILTNCNQFLMLHAAMDSGKSSIEFSEPISGGEPSKGQLSASHLGFLLGATMLAFRRHTEKMSTTELAAYTKLPTTLLLETLACDKFGGGNQTYCHGYADTSRSRDALQRAPAASSGYVDSRGVPVACKS